MNFYDNPTNLSPGDKVWFMGMKAKVLDSYWNYLDGVPFKYWAVPIWINGTDCATIAHVNMLMPRGKKK